MGITETLNDGLGQEQKWRVRDSPDVQDSTLPRMGGSWGNETGELEFADREELCRWDVTPD